MNDVDAIVRLETADTIRVLGSKLSREFGALYLADTKKYGPKQARIKLRRRIRRMVSKGTLPA